jgi:hypothetical protein
MAINEVGGVEEWEQYKDAVAQEAAQENFDGLSPQQAAKKLARLHRMVRGEAALNNQQTLTEKRQEADRLAKIQAQSLSGTPSPFQEPTKDEAAVAGILRAAKEGGYESLVNG